MAEIIYNKMEIKKFAAHLSTIGAFVQQPDPGIVGVEETEILFSCDAKSLYPTIMALLNIGFDTLYARVYDPEIVSGFFTLLDYYFKNRHTDRRVRTTVQGKIIDAIRNLITQYTKRESADSKAERIKFNTNYYSILLIRLLDYPGDLENIFRPQGDREYFLLKSNLFPLLEFFNWTSANNKKYSKVITDRIFHNEKTVETSSGIINSNYYKEEYSNKKFYMFTDINSTKTQFHIMNFDQAENILSNYLLNPYGTIYYNQNQKKSFSVDIIINDMLGRAKVKNKMLILSAIYENWNSLTEKEKNSFVLDNSGLEPSIAKSIIEKVGDPEEKKRNWQLSNLLSVVFFTINTSYEQALNKHKNIKYQIDIMIQQLNTRQNGIKTSLNSDYGIYAMIAWEYANFLISNSITTGGKVLGTNLFQQIAKNVLIDSEMALEIVEQNRDLEFMNQVN